MTFALISDNHDTQMGLRLAGIEGVVVHTREEIEQAIQAALDREDVAVLLITEGLVPLCADTLNRVRLEHTRPLVVEIPDRHADGRRADSILKTVQDVIGVRI